MEKIKIIIADDIFANRLLLTEIIKDLGFESTAVENGKLALEAIQEGNYDIVLMDIEMPVMNGLETTENIRNTLNPPKNMIPVIALTAHNPHMFFDDFNDAGFTDLITKPYSIEKIKNVIHNYTEKK